MTDDRDELIDRIATLEKERDDAYARGKADGANEERTLNWSKERVLVSELRERIATLEAALRDSNARNERNLGVDGISDAEIENRMRFAEANGSRRWTASREVLAARAALRGGKEGE